MCEHQFCRDCWREYLTIKIMDEGIGQVDTVTVMYNFANYVFKRLTLR